MAQFMFTALAVVTLLLLAYRQKIVHDANSSTKLLSIYSNPENVTTARLQRYHSLQKLSGINLLVFFFAGCTFLAGLVTLVEITGWLR